MKRWFLLFLLMVFAVSSPVAEATNWGDILGGLGKIGSSEGKYGTWRIAGKIVDKNKEPIEGIDVMASFDGGGNYSAKTNSSGNYVLNIPANKSFKLILSGDTWRTLIDTFGTGHGAGTSDVWNYTMHHNYMGGKITTTNGIPLQWVKLVFEEDGSASGIHELYTDEYGNYQFVLPKSGSYYWVTISLDGYRTVREHQHYYDEEVWNVVLRES